MFKDELPPAHATASWSAREAIKSLEARSRRDGFVYFVQGVRGGPIKIGFAADPATRLAELQVGSNVRLRILCAVPAALNDERTMHARFKKDRLHGEWFSASGRLKRFIADIVESGIVPACAGSPTPDLDQSVSAAAAHGRHVRGF